MDLPNNSVIHDCAPNEASAAALPMFAEDNFNIFEINLLWF